MKKYFFVVSLVLSVLVLASCGNGISQGNGVYVPSAYLSMEQAEQSLGSVNSVYKNNHSARFCNNQKIKCLYGFEEVQFYGELVEYNSLSQSLLDYVENLEHNNSLMNQSYDDFVFDSEKKYVELGSFTDVSTGQVVLYDVRIFYGNFIDTYASEGWYAKCVTFSPDLKVDVDKGINIETGEKVVYKGSYEGEIYSIFFNQTEFFPDVISKFGEVEEVYSCYDSNGCHVCFTGWDGSDASYGYLVVLSSVDEKLKSYFDKWESCGQFQYAWYEGVEFEEDKYYIEYSECLSEDGSVSAYVVNLLTDFENFSSRGTCYIKGQYVDSSSLADGQDAYSYIVSLLQN